MDNTAINTTTKTNGKVTVNGIITDVSLNEDESTPLGMNIDGDTVNSGVSVLYMLGV